MGTIHMPASGVRWPGPVICHCHVILSLSSSAVLLAALENSLLCMSSTAISDANFNFTFSSPYQPASPSPPTVNPITQHRSLPPRPIHDKHTTATRHLPDPKLSSSQSHCSASCLNSVSLFYHKGSSQELGCAVCQPAC